MDEGLGFGFWVKLFGLFVLGAIVVFIVLIFVSRAVYAWGFFGAIIAIAVIGLLAAWIHDRRDARRHEGDY